MPSALLSLVGRRIAVTRAAGPDDALARALVDLGAEVLEAPSIAIADPESWDDLDAALRALETFAWIAFASGTAVDRLVARGHVLGIADAALRRPLLAAVGRATARRLELQLRAPDVVPAAASGAALAAALAPAVRGARVLVPRAAEGRPELLDGLAEAGALVTAPVAYRTVPVSAEALAPLADALRSRSVDAVLFASPSAVRSVVGALGPDRSWLPAVTVAAIGPTTAAQLAALGLPVHVQPPVATAQDLARAVAEWLGPRPPGRAAPRHD